MNKQTIDERVKTYYKTQQLRPEKLTELLALVNDTSQTNSTDTVAPAISNETLSRRWFWQRNLAIALGNGPPDEEVINALKTTLPKASAMVAEHIRWALARLSSA